MIILVMLLVAVLLVATSKTGKSHLPQREKKRRKPLINATKRERQGDMIMRKAFVWIGTVVLILLCVKAIVDNKKRKEAI